MINKLIQKRLKIDDAHCPYNIEEFGNTSSTSIPLMIVSKLKDRIASKRIIACGFGTGLAWGALCADLVEDLCVVELKHLNA